MSVDVLKLLRESGGKSVKIPLSSPDAQRPPQKRISRATGPGLARQAFNYTKARVAHAVAGFPACTEEQVAKRFAICESNHCGLYKIKVPGEHGKCMHASCGCSLKNVGIKGKNKLHYAEQACPVGEWGSEVQSSS